MSVERITSVVKVGYIDANLEPRTVRGMNLDVLARYILHAVIKELLAPDNGQLFWDQVGLIAILQKQ